MNHYNLVMIVIASRGNIYDKIIDIYWKKFINYIEKNNLNLKVFLLYGNCNLDDIDIKKENILQFNDITDSLIPGILEKTIEAFKYINNNFSYKHILRTNISSFFIIDNLIKINNILNKEKIYAGVIGNHPPLKTLFCSGAGFWISKDICNFIIENEKNIDFKIIDDVSIGNFLYKKNMKLTKLNRFDILR